MSKIELMNDNGKTFVRKSGGVHRNLERFDALSKLNLSLPKILEVYGNAYDMEYIANEDIKTFLSNHNVNPLIDFLVSTIKKLSENTIEKDYSKVYEQKLSHFPYLQYKLPFTSDELYARLPKSLPSSEYHGDLTLENILYRISEDSFVLIDPLTTEYDSYVFDLAKLRQDLVCRWFIRYDKFYFDTKLQLINEALSQFEHFNNDYLLILMLMRVLPYMTIQGDKEFIENEIRKLWK